MEKIQKYKGDNEEVESKGISASQASNYYWLCISFAWYSNKHYLLGDMIQIIADKMVYYWNFDMIGKENPFCLFLKPRIRKHGQIY
jgi:hypothetical protein